ncbi:MAG TPA: ABC transporter ATP-binding protein [Methylomusa anaerophila]|uniref:Oligopeptide transport ATP-binding protein OppF n=1 Tax=Methylomusa anaerophila TaxID=1930071 RepID=A0A348AIB8_9FIRM|nr:ABC transporter ATP-binding protein [Methylomusa anaerophila]BBB90816.1 oligopeptide transport ATP-binding protein OppF [Methylomusa anaerophila]HML90527.1 ABC transporter ATP-binding protein [Methylomusa anaerophila]
MSAAQDLLVVNNLKKYFPIHGGLLGRTVGHVRAVDDVSFTVKKGETLGLVGESGCGKSTTGLLVLRLLEMTGGEVLFAGQDVAGLNRSQLKTFRRQAQIVFQDPYASLNPRMPVGDIIAEPMTLHGIAAGPERTRRVEKLLRLVGLGPQHAGRYPHEFSGGQRQRIGIARALAVQPKLVVCDEPVSALDVSIQSQILNLLVELQQEMGLTYLFIAHGLNVIKHISDRIGVMYLGKIVELADGNELIQNPLHPYTRTLLSAIPVPDPGAKRKRIILQGDVPSPANPPAGCRFHTRCPECMDICSKEEPAFREVGPERFVACHLVK